MTDQSFLKIAGSNGWHVVKWNASDPARMLFQISARGEVTYADGLTFDEAKEAIEHMARTMATRTDWWEELWNVAKPDERTTLEMLLVRVRDSKEGMRPLPQPERRTDK